MEYYAQTMFYFFIPKLALFSAGRREPDPMCINGVLFSYKQFIDQIL